MAPLSFDYNMFLSFRAHIAQSGADVIARPIRQSIRRHVVVARDDVKIPNLKLYMRKYDGSEWAAFFVCECLLPECPSVSIDQSGNSAHLLNA